MAVPFLGSINSDKDMTSEQSGMELPAWPQDEEGWMEASADHPLDLSMLWKVLEKHKEVMQEKEEAGMNINTTWELVVVQGVILTVLVLISLMWAVCCRRRCFTTDPDTVSVSEALRKLSRDLPPSYSTRDLHTLGISVNDHLHPPPAYLELFKDDLQYLDLEAGHSRMAKLSFCNPEGGSPRLARLSVASCATCSSDSPVIVPVQREETGRASMSSTASSSRRNSRNSTSSRASRVSFSEDVECSNGSIRRLSSNALNSLVTGGHSGSSSRKSSSSSEGSRKSSLISKVQDVKRKLASNSSINNESFISQLDEELKTKLERIGDPDTVPDTVPDTADQEAEKLAERQAERAARVCDIIHE